jgi:hypothetical protein
MHIAQLTANVQRDVTLFGIADLPMDSSLRSGIPALRAGVSCTH